MPESTSVSAPLTGGPSAYDDYAVSRHHDNDIRSPGLADCYRHIAVRAARPGTVNFVSYSATSARRADVSGLVHAKQPARRPLP